VANGDDLNVIVEEPVDETVPADDDFANVLPLKLRKDATRAAENF